MVQFFKQGAATVYAVETDHRLSDVEKQKLQWAFSGARPVAGTSLKGRFIGPRREMITPWKSPRIWVSRVFRA